MSLLSYRLYLINSPVVRAETLKFKEQGVKDVIKDVFLPWYNAYRFLMQSVVQLEKVTSVGRSVGRSVVSGTFKFSVRLDMP